MLAGESDADFQDRTRNGLLSETHRSRMGGDLVVAAEILGPLHVEKRTRYAPAEALASMHFGCVADVPGVGGVA